MLKMDNLVIRLVYFCSLSVSFLASQDPHHDHRPNRLDTDPDMNLMPMTRYRPMYTTPRPMTLREPIMLPGMPHHPKDPEDYEYYNYKDESSDFGMASSGHVDDHLESTTHLKEEEYVYTDAGASNARNEFFLNSASRFTSWQCPVLFSTILALLLL